MSTLELDGRISPEALLNPGPPEPDSSDAPRLRYPIPEAQIGGAFLVEQGLLTPEDLKVHVTGLKDYRPPYMDDVGLTTYREAELSTGFYHRVINGVAREPRTKMIARIGTPWFCDVEGFIEHFGRRLLAKGLSYQAIGGEQIHVGLPTPSNVRRAVEHSRNNITLPRSALAELRIMNAADRELPPYIDPSESILIGASRPAMSEPAKQIMAPDHGFTIHWSEDIDPGVSDKIQFWPPDVPLEVLIAERDALWAVGKRIITSPLRRHYGKTFNKSPDSFIPQMMTGRTILSAVGGQLADIAPSGRQRLVSLCELSLAQNKGYRRRYDGLDGTHVVELVGAHMSIPDIWPLVEERVDVLLEELEANGDNPALVDYQRLKDIADRQAADLQEQKAQVSTIVRAFA